MKLTKYKEIKSGTFIRKICWLESHILGVNSYLRMWLRRKLNK